MAQSQSVATNDMAAVRCWTPARVEQLRGLWADGASCSAIANALGPDVSRNAVIGKAHRLLLPKRKEPLAPIHESCPIDFRTATPLKVVPATKRLVPINIARKRARTEKPAVKAGPKPTAIAAKVNTCAAAGQRIIARVENATPRKSGKGVRFLDRRLFECAWIVNEDERHNPMCCGAKTVGIGSWCAEHAARCFTPSTFKPKRAA